MDLRRGSKCAKLRKSMATLTEVADLAGVSIATVSTALNGGPVQESTRKRVLDCAKQLNYIPNRIGRTLNTGKSNTIALLMMTCAEYADIVHTTSPFYYLQQGVLVHRFIDFRSNLR
jgi:DNA-binding LacI/PurR family transcriptional regulator